jgi:glycosyltransferase involved in cell wall biosynthesis
MTRATYKIVVLVDKDLPTDHSFIQGMFEKALPSRGHEVVFVGFGDPGTTHPSVRFNLVKPWGNNFWFRKLQKLISFSRLVLQEKPSVLFTRNDPTYLMVAWFARLRMRGLVHIHQISHLHAYSTNLRKNWLYNLKANGDLALRRMFMRSADCVYLISDAMAEFLKPKWPSFSSRFRIFPLGVTDSEFGAPSQFTARKVTFAYIGTLSASRELQVLADACLLYKQQYGDIQIHFWGASHNKQDDEKLAAYVLEKGLQSNMIFHGRVSRMEVLSALQQVRIGLSLIPPKGMLKQISPTKMMEYMASGCFVLASHGIPEQENILNASGGGILVEFEAEKIAEGFARCLSDMTACEKGAARGRQYILAHRSYSGMAESLLNDIRNVNSTNVN